MSKRISFSFSGWVRNAEIKTATDPETGEEIDISNMDSEEIFKKFDSGKLVISFVDAYENSNKTECEMFDFEIED
jgi:hypothetical protein